jgi:hypothetical protein
MAGQEREWPDEDPALGPSMNVRFRQRLTLMVLVVLVVLGVAAALVR